MKMTDFKFEIKDKMGVLSEGNKGWKKEINLISWNGAEPKFDIRDWDENHEKMGKGITLTNEELNELYKVLAAIFE